MTKFKQIFNYVSVLLVYLYLYWFATSSLYLLVDDSFFIYIGNILLILGILAGRKADMDLFESLHVKLKKDTFIKRYIKKSLANESRLPSMKAALYLFYTFCLVAERFVYYNVAERLSIELSFIENYRGYFSNMYYSLIFLLAADKFKDYITKESKYRKKYYAKYEDQKDKD